MGCQLRNPLNMAEKRKPTITMLLKIRSKKNTGKWVTNRVELFPVQLWAQHRFRGDRYRLRSNGKWFSRNGKEFDAVTLSEFFGLVRKSTLGRKARPRR